jgi:glycolate oxidase
MPIIPRGSGTGLSGGSVAVNGGMILCLNRLNQLLEIDEANLTATAQTGMITLDFFNAVAEKGLFYPPDPASQKISTLGGNISEDAGGLRGLKYGVTRDYVMALSGVFADGTPFSTGGKNVKDVAGYALKDLLVGSEGTARIIAAKIIPSTMEIMDGATLRCVENYVKIGLPMDMDAMLLIEVDGHHAQVVEEADDVRAVLEQVGAAEIQEAADAAHAEQLATARRTALSALARLAPTTLLEDATVPRSRLAETFDEIKRLTEKYQLQVGTFGHAGDGNLHPTVICDERNKEEMERAHAFYHDLYEKVLEWGGTVSGEHGIGLAKMDYLKRQVGEGGLAIMRRIKRDFDPDNLLNPGKIFDQGNREKGHE